MDELSVKLLDLLAAEGTQSAARVAKKLGLAQSQLRRLLTQLGDNTTLGGLGLVEVREDGERLLLSLSTSAVNENLLTMRQVQALRINANQHEASRETVAEECAIALVYNGISHAVMMATPDDLEDFARGFSLTEGIIEQAGELLDMDVVAEAIGISLHIKIPEQRFHALKDRRRTLTGRTGCHPAPARRDGRPAHYPGHCASRFCAAGKYADVKSRHRRRTRGRIVQRG